MKEAAMPLQKWMAGTLLVLGLALLGYMVVFEGEPGLLPLVLVAVGAAWLWVAMRRKPSGG